MSRMHVDVTQLVHWQGKLTGIPRVMNELSIRYFQDPEVNFIIWDKPSKSYVRIDVKATLKTRGKKLHYAHEQTILRKSSYFTFRALRKLRAQRAPIPQIVMQPFESQGSKRKAETFAAGDRILILWGELNDNNFISEIVRLHKKNVKIVQVAYDMLPLVTPQFSGHSTKSMEVYNRRIFPICEQILSISEYTKIDIQNWLKERKLPVPPVNVFRLGDDFDLSTPQKPVDTKFKKSGLKGGDFLLCVGTIEARKNHTLLYYAYKLAHTQGTELPKIVIVGRKGWLADNIYEIIKLDPEIKDKFVVLEGIADEELSWLYDNALLTVYPSFYEGWGLPIAESIAHGTPCICSNTSSMPEIAGELITYFSPYSADECLNTIVSTLGDKELASARKKIKKYKPTSWDDTFRQVEGYIGDSLNAKNN